jgi:iron complex transport system substrate-binding protein
MACLDRRSILCTSIVAILLLLMGCGPRQGAPTAAPGPAGAGPAALTVMGRAFTLGELQAFEQASTEVDGKAYVGVRLTDVLAAAEVQAANVALVGSDGYSANVTVAELTDACLLAFNASGGLDAVLPGVSKSAWVRDTVAIREGAPTSAAPDPAASDGATPAQPAGPVSGPIKLTDAAGRTVELPGLPQRLVVVGRGPHMALHLLYMFPEGRQRLVGMEKKGATASDFLPIVDASFDGKTVLDANPNVEQIAALMPDLVIMKGVMADKMSETLALAGIPSVYLALETPEQFTADITNLGIILGNEERAEEILAFYRERLERLRQRVGEIEDADRPGVLLMEYSDRGGSVAVQVPARAWMQTIEVQTAGGNPIWLEAAQGTDGWTVVNLEQIARWDPDKLFLVVWYTLDPQRVIDTLKADPQWSALQAVKNNEIYAFPADIYGWDQPEPRWILGMEWLATRLYPERFADIDMRQEILAFFGELYGMDHAAIEANIMPKVRMDVR